MAKKSQGMDSQAAIKLAKAYYQEGKRIEQISKKDINENSDLLYNYIVGNTNLAFACEISIKVLLIKQGMLFDKLPQTHRLEDLFGRLLDVIKNPVINMTVGLCNASLTYCTYSISDFYNDLSKNSDAFETSRYWYEFPAPGKTHQASILFISSFAQALLHMVDTLNNAQK